MVFGTDLIVKLRFDLSDNVTKLKLEITSNFSFKLPHVICEWVFEGKII